VLLRFENRQIFLPHPVDIPATFQQLLGTRHLNIHTPQSSGVAKRIIKPKQAPRQTFAIGLYLHRINKHTGFIVCTQQAPIHCWRVLYLPPAEFSFGFCIHHSIYKVQTPDTAKHYPQFEIAVELALQGDPSNSVAAGRVYHAGEVRGDDAHKKRYSRSPSWGTGVVLKFTS
jgi:hypothetical protein